MKTKKLGIGFRLCFLLIAISSCSNNEKSPSKEVKVLFSDPQVVAVVNGEAIRSSDVDNVIQQFLHQLGKDPHQFLGQKADTTLWREALNWIISMRLLTQEAHKQSLTVDNKEVDVALNIIKRRFPSEQKFLDALKEAQLSMEQFVNNVTNELMVQKLLDQKIVPKMVDVSDEDALQHYNEHGDRFIQDEQIRVHHLLIKLSETADKEKIKSAEDKARRILERIKRGEDIENLARQYSEDPASALKGGDLGFFCRGDMIKNFEDAAFALKEGEVSDIVRTPLGFHIIRMDERKPRQKIPFNKVKTEINSYLKQERFNRLLQGYVDELKSRAKISLREQV